MNPPRSPRATRDTGFTLVELLVVIAIIAILAGLLIQGAGYVQEKAGRARAEAEIQAVSGGLESYKLDFGNYPEGNGGEGSTKVLIEELALNPAKDTSGDKYGGKKPFEFPQKMLSGYRASQPRSYDDLLEASDYLQDPFGNRYYYEFDADPDWANEKRSGKGAFNLWSKGKKNSDDEKLWIKNW
jgi:prepilin-type N-terminal cleavage/methylation domain-containing protein